MTQFLTCLRVMIAANGGLCGDVSERAVLIDEYRVAPLPQDGSWNLRPRADVWQYVRQTWAAYMGCVLHVFQTRGHHWKEDYAEVYERTWNACAIPVPQGLRIPNWQ